MGVLTSMILSYPMQGNQGTGRLSHEFGSLFLLYLVYNWPGGVVFVGDGD